MRLVGVAGVHRDGRKVVSVLAIPQAGVDPGDNRPAWSPAAEQDWRGFLTVDARRLLRANGYLDQP